MADKANDFSQFEGPGAKYAPKAKKQHEQGTPEGVADLPHTLKDHSADTDEWGVPMFKHHESEAYDAAKEAEKYIRR